MIDRFNADMLKQASDTAGLVINTAALDSALQDASDEIDGYLQARYQLPFVEPPRVLLLLSCDIAMYRMLALRQQGDIKDQRERYEDAVKFLTKVSKGEIQLGLASDNSAPALTEGPVVRAPERTFNRKRLKNF
jgi:phage gp36-like protein